MELSFVVRSKGLCESATTTAIPGLTVNAACAASSLRWSQVSGRQICSGSVLLNLGGTLGDEHDRVDVRSGLLTSSCLKNSGRPSGAQTRAQLPVQRASALDVERLVDRLVELHASSRRFHIPGLDEGIDADQGPPR